MNLTNVRLQKKLVSAYQNCTKDLRDVKKDSKPLVKSNKKFMHDRLLLHVLTKLLIIKKHNYYVNYHKLMSLPSTISRCLKLSNKLYALPMVNKEKRIHYAISFGGIHQTISIAHRLNKNEIAEI